MDLYAKYIKEREDLELLSTEDAFLTYKIGDGWAFIQDLYVVPENRKSYVASKLADKVVEIAIERGCTELYGQVDKNANEWERSIKVLEGYGMSPCKEQDNMIYFKKKIG